MSFLGTECVLCGRHPASPHGEPTQALWPVGEPGDELTIAGSEAARDDDRSFLRTTVSACRSCGIELRARFEEPAKAVVRSLVDGRLRLRPADARTFVLWALKTSLLTAHPSAQVGYPGSGVIRFDLSEAPDDIYGWLVEAKPPPSGLSLWAARSAGDAVAGNAVYRIPLPTITADARTVRFQELTGSLDLLDAGRLDLDLVYHPGWEIDHPLEREDRAVRLWPRDGRRALDLGALPFVDPDELGWVRGPRLVFAPNAFRGRSREPLSPETTLSFFPPFPPGVTAVFAPGE
jgi:hypothetical protein